MRLWEKKTKLIKKMVKANYQMRMFNLFVVLLPFFSPNITENFLSTVFRLLIFRV